MKAEHAIDGDGLYQVTSLSRGGWGWRCLCGSRSPLFGSGGEAGQVFSEHAQSPPAPLSRRERRDQKRTQT